MIVVTGKRQTDLSREQVGAACERYTKVTVDLGGGDGAFAYRYAQAHADRFVIAIDPVAENVRHYSQRASRKSAKGGLSNVVYAVASVERIPGELRAIADEIFVTLPWGSLMRGIILGDEVVLGGIAALARPAGIIRIVLNTRIFDDPVPVEARDLPDVTPEYVTTTLGPAFGRHGLRIDSSRWMDADEVAAIGTTWAKRLSHRTPPRSVEVIASRSV